MGHAQETAVLSGEKEDKEHTFNFVLVNSRVSNVKSELSQSCYYLLPTNNSNTIKRAIDGAADNSTIVVVYIHILCE